MILTDNETKVDLLNNETVATTIVRLLRARPDCPVTIGVHGDWGAGKSSVLEMIDSALENQDRVLCLKFNGWRFQGFEDAKIALLEGIVTGLIEKRPMLTKASEAVKSIFRRIDWLKVAKKTSGLAFSVYTGLPSHDQVQAALTMIEGAFSDPTKLKENAKVTIEGVKSLLKPEADMKNVPEEISEFRKAFDRLLKEAGIDQLIVLIDDLDRCLPDTAIETLEAIRLFVFTSRTAFVVAADEAMIEYAVRKHFPDLPNSTGPQTYARNYLEKLIQVPFRIPALGETETRIYVTLLLAGAELGENDPDFSKLIAKARELLKRPWTGRTLDPATVRTVLGDKYGKVQSALTLSDQIGPVLASGTKGNPRQIKRFLNTLVLRQKMAEARGFGEDINLPVLAKLMLAERFLPFLFNQIASAAAAATDGVCDDLQSIETVATDNAPESRQKPKPGSGKTPIELTAIPSAETSASGEWANSSAIKSWATIQPPLFGVDLRPYLFVAKDRKDDFGPSSTLGHLAILVEKLFGPKIAVQSLQEELKLLVATEAAQVFEIIRGRIIAGDAFENQPDGVEGLTVLVKAHPVLQTDLLTFLESLPTAHLGAWAVTGWSSVVIDSTAKQRLSLLVQKWTGENQNKILQTAANAVLRIDRTNR